jgi:hypothetical protein
MNGAPDKIHNFVRWSVIAAYVAVFEWIAVSTGDPTDLWWWLAEFPFSIWIIAPIALPLLLRLRHWLLTGGVTAMAAYGVYVYVDSMIGPGVRSTSGLVFIFLPFYQWLGTGILIVLAAVMSRRTSP